MVMTHVTFKYSTQDIAHYHKIADTHESNQAIRVHSKSHTYSLLSTEQ